MYLPAHEWRCPDSYTTDSCDTGFCCTGGQVEELVVPWTFQPRMALPTQLDQHQMTCLLCCSGTGWSGAASVADMYLPVQHWHCPDSWTSTRCSTGTGGVKLVPPSEYASAAQVLGGQVEELVDAWTFQRKFGTAQRAGPATDDTEQPPAFQSFIPGRRHNQSGHRYCS